jgi:hypothetical protein
MEDQGLIRLLNADIETQGRTIESMNRTIESMNRIIGIQGEINSMQKGRIKELEESMRGTEALRNRRGILHLVTNKAKAGQMAEK